MKPVYRNLIFLCLFFALVANLWHLGNLKTYISIATIQQNQAFICQAIATHPFLCAATYMASFFILTVSALPVTLIMVTMSGFLFGWKLGSCYAFISTLASSVCVFYISQRMFGVYLQEKYNVELKKFNSAMQRYGFYSLLIIRIVPIIPFFIVNMCAGLTHIDTKTFIITTALGAIPSLVICSYLGSQCASLVVNL